RSAHAHRRCGHRGVASPAAAGHDDRDDCGVRPRAAAVRHRPGIGDPASARDRGHRRPDQLHAADPAAVAGPVPAFWRPTRNAVVAGGIEPMTERPDTLLTLVVPAALEETVADLLLDATDIAVGFTTSLASGHGATLELRRGNERVRGRGKRVKFEIALSR